MNKPSLRHGEQTIATTRRAPAPATRTAVCSGCHTQPGAAQQRLEPQIPNRNLLLLLKHLQTGCQGVQDSGFSYELTPSSRPVLSVLETCRFTLVLESKHCPQTRVLSDRFCLHQPHTGARQGELCSSFPQDSGCGTTPCRGKAESWVSSYQSLGQPQCPSCSPPPPIAPQQRPRCWSPRHHKQLFPSHVNQKETTWLKSPESRDAKTSGSATLCAGLGPRAQ